MLFLIGPSKIGKTHWAQSLAGHSYMMSQWYGAALDSRHKLVIFDDFKDELLAQVQPFAFGQKDIVYTVSNQLHLLLITHTL